MARFKLNVDAMEKHFFSEASLIGVRSPLAGYMFCWLVNRAFSMKFRRVPDSDIALYSKSHVDPVFFAVYKYESPLSKDVHVLYQLRNDPVHLLPEIKQLDYLWMIQGGVTPEELRALTMNLLSLHQVEHATIVEPERLKHLNYLMT